jgi:hypothetical protein
MNLDDIDNVWYNFAYLVYLKSCRQQRINLNLYFNHTFELHYYRYALYTYLRYK